MNEYNKTEKKIKVLAVNPLQEFEIEFEDEIIIENEEKMKINAYIPLYNIDIFKKFGIKEKVKFEYNMYLDYYPMENKSEISIVEKSDNEYIEYKYQTLPEENEMLKSKLDKYCLQKENKNIEELIEETDDMEF